PLLGRDAPRPAVHAAVSLRALEDGRRDHRHTNPDEDRLRERAADAGSDDPVGRDRDATSYGRARREADRSARRLDLAAAVDDLRVRRAGALPARSRAGGAREDEPGAGDSRDVPAAARPGTDAADRAGVPERGRAGRRAGRPAARGDDDADG